MGTIDPAAHGVCIRCRVHVRAWEVGDKRVAVQATLASRCAHPLTITACHTQPQVRALRE
jgi:hypothetical protein